MPFNTHAGSGAGDTHDEIVRMEPDAVVLEGLPVRGDDTESDLSDTVKTWLEKIGK